MIESSATRIDDYAVETVGFSNRWQIANRYSIKISINDQSIKLPTNQSSKPNWWPIDNQDFKEGSIIYRLSEAIDIQSIDWPSIGHRSEKLSIIVLLL